MTILEFLNKATSFLQPILGYGSVLFVLFVAWGYVSNDDFGDESDTVTITFRCAHVLANREQYPEIVISECVKLRTE